MDDEEVLYRLTRLYVSVSARYVRHDEAEAFLAMWREMERIEADRHGSLKDVLQQLDERRREARREIEDGALPKKGRFRL